MNIDRHNYEEYFLLYIDNELSVDQKKQVELFVQENPDLEEELVMLQQSRLIPDDSIVFDKKHLLMKDENARHSSNHSFINLNNYEQWLIMYVDDELSAEERAAVEKFASAHQHVRQELELFQQTKLQAEEIVFPDKEILYRREKTVRVISIQWWRVAVAAILIIAAGVTFYSALHNRGNSGTTPNSIAINKNEQTPAPKQTISPGKQEDTVSTGEEEKGRETTESVAIGKPENKNSRLEKDKPQFADNLSLPETKNSIAKDVITETPSDVVDEFRTTTIEGPKKNDVVVVENESPKENINPDPVTKTGVGTPYKSSTSDDAVQYASNAENKKFRGFFRKATRLIERTTNINAAEDDKVLIGGMAINLK